MADSGFVSVEKISSALNFVSPDDRVTWVKVGMGLKAELGEAGFDFFDDWSRLGSSYSNAAAKASWRSFKAGGKVTIASLFYLAKTAGWTWNKPDVKPTKEAMEKWREESRHKAEKAEAEKRALNEAAAFRARVIWDKAKPAPDDHPYLLRKGVKAHGLRVGPWEVVDKDSGEIRLVHPNALLVPICDRTRAIWSLQAIFPVKVMGGRDKDYLADGAKVGHFHCIGGAPKSHNGKRVFVLCEGYATGASIHEATGHTVMVCFDTSGLLPVACAIRERVQDAIILIAGDNDLWNRRKDGSSYNPGLEAATKAAQEVGAFVAVPPFSEADQSGTDDKGRPCGPTDFNDLAAIRGAGAVVACIEEALNGTPFAAGAVVEPEPDPEISPEEAAFPGGALPPAEQPPIDGNEEDERHLAKNKHFTVLGYDRDEYYFFVHAKQQILCRKRGDFNEMGLLELANDINWWEVNFPGPKGGVNLKSMFTWVQAIAHARGVYDPTRLRGRGAWVDDGRVIYHLGDVLLVDGKTLSIEELPSSYVYPRDRKMPRPSGAPLSIAEGRKLHRVSSMVRWSRPGSSVLMSGWAFLSPVSGALKWRPHIWITGPAGSGKSTVQRDFCYALARGFAVYAQGNSTEAGIRQKLRSDAVAVLIDEFESNDDRERQRTSNVLSMIRQASSESDAQTLKGTTTGDGLDFHIRSMFCLASINVNLEKQADRDRITKLSIRVPVRDGSEVDHWAKLEAELYAIVNDEGLPGRMVSRALGMLPTVLATVKVFTGAAAKHFRSQRMGDQYGTLIAGCWCLCNDHVPSEAEAADMLGRYNWDEHTEDSDHDDAIEALQSIMATKVRIGSSMPDVTVAELIREAHTIKRTGTVDQKIAADTLGRHGIRLHEGETDKLVFGVNNKNLKSMVKDTAFATDLRGQLLRIKGAQRMDGTLSFAGAASRCISVPLAAALEQDDVSPPVSWPGQDDDFPI